MTDTILKINNKRCQKALFELIEDYNLIDVWRSRNKNTQRYSWQKNSTQQASRIDYALLTQSMENRCENTFYFQGIQTDHSAYIITVKDLVHERGSGYWKCNVKILESSDVVQSIKRRIVDTALKCDGSDPIKDWETLKECLIKVLKAQSRKKSSEKKEKNSELVRKVEWL